MNGREQVMQPGGQTEACKFQREDAAEGPQRRSGQELEHGWSRRGRAVSMPHCKAIYHRESQQALAHIKEHRMA